MGTSTTVTKMPAKSQTDSDACQRGSEILQTQGYLQKTAYSEYAAVFEMLYCALLRRRMHESGKAAKRLDLQTILPAKQGIRRTDFEGLFSAETSRGKPAQKLNLFQELNIFIENEMSSQVFRTGKPVPILLWNGIPWHPQHLNPWGRVCSGEPVA